MKFTSKPRTIEAFQWFENGTENPRNAVRHDLIDLGRAVFVVTTIHGQKTVVVDGDWIITESDGIHFYPCKPDVFEATYERVEDGEDDNS